MARGGGEGMRGEEEKRGENQKIKSTQWNPVCFAHPTPLGATKKGAGSGISLFSHARGEAGFGNPPPPNQPLIWASHRHDGLGKFLEGPEPMEQAPSGAGRMPHLMQGPPSPLAAFLRPKGKCDSSHSGCKTKNLWCWPAWQLLSALTANKRPGTGPGGGAGKGGAVLCGTTVSSLAERQHGGGAEGGSKRASLGGGAGPAEELRPLPSPPPTWPSPHGRESGGEVRHPCPERSRYCFVQVGREEAGVRLCKVNSGLCLPSTRG